MRLAALKKWYWMAISLLVGVLVAWVRSGDPGDIHGDHIDEFGYVLGSQQLFENALTDKYEGRPRFSDIMVYPRRIDDGHGGSRPVNIVTGEFRRPVEDAPGHTVTTSNRAFIVTHVPYEPLIDLSAFNKPGGPDYDKVFRDAGTRPSVIDFLATLHAAAGVDYQYAWWDAYAYLIWPLVSFVLIGLIWPTAVNLMTFGKLTRPPEAKGMSLWNIRRGTKPAAPPVVPIKAPEAARDDEPVDLVEATDEPRDAAAPAPIARLSAEAPTQTASADLTSKEFGARPDDYYPTERHVQHPEK